VETRRRQEWYSVKDALVASGFSESESLKFAQACCGSSSILKRLITRYPETDFPAWCRDDNRAAMAPFALIGGWTHVDVASQPATNPKVPVFGSPPPIDLWIVQELVGCTREALEGHVVRWQLGAEPLFVRFGKSVLVASREDAWHLLGGAVSEVQLKRFEGLAELVLDEDNPAFQLDREQRWMASILGKVHSLSPDLRRSIVETLVLMATYPTADGPVQGLDLKKTVRSVLERVLPANAPWKRWATFGRNLPIIAEADPDLFLSRVELDLRSPDPELPKLFQDQSHGIFGGAIHTDLLWALEGLAWSPDYLTPVAVCLAKLASRDPGGTYANRPANSLREVFLLWLWHTNATVADRMEALKEVLKVEPGVGWALLKNLLPSGTSSVSHETHIPRWRPWADGWSRGKMRSHIGEYANAIAELTIESAGLDGERWSEVLDGMLRFSPSVTAKVFAVLEKICDVKATLDRKGIFALWSAMNRLVSRHERYREASWVFDEATRGRLNVICDRLQPAESVLKNQWLFNHRAQLRGFDLVKDHEAHDIALQEARLSAMKEIIAESGTGGVFRLLDMDADSSMVGWIVGANSLIPVEELQLPTVLDNPGDRKTAFVAAYIQSRFRAGGWPFVEQIRAAKWLPDQIATFAIFLGFHEDIWQWIRRFGTEAETSYWRRVNAFLRNPTLHALQTATESLINVGRGANAIDVLHYSASTNKLELPGPFVGEVLEKALGNLGSERSMAGNFSYAAQQLIKYLQEDGEFDRIRLARIEWGYLPLLDTDFGEVGPKTLVEAVNAEPSLYIDLLKVVYRGEHDEPSEDSLSEEEQLKGQHAHRLLDKLSRLPGTRDDGSVDWVYLRDWVKAVQTMAASNDRRGICDLTLGQFVARASIKLEKDWPSLELAKLTDEVGSDSFFEGFGNGVINSRGVTMRDPLSGGDQERSLAEKFKQHAKKVRSGSPRLAMALLQLAEHYEAYAKQEDSEAERLRMGKH
jgi:hypothetical protein